MLVRLYSILYLETIAKSKIIEIVSEGRIKMANEDIRDYAKLHKVKLWEIAAELGITDVTLSKKLRFEIDADEKRKIMKLIDQIAVKKTA